MDKNGEMTKSEVLTSIGEAIDHSHDFKMTEVIKLFDSNGIGKDGSVYEIAMYPKEENKPKITFRKTKLYDLVYDLIMFFEHGKRGTVKARELRHPKLADKLKYFHEQLHPAE